jgi:tetratricopeptide (TPR) repeat protein
VSDLARLAERAQAAIARRDWPGAVRALQTLIERGPAPSAALLYNLGLAFERQGKSAEAADWLARAIEVDPAHAKARFELGAALLELGRPEAALDAFDAYLDLQPSDGDALLNAARLALRLGHLEKAGDISRRLAAVRPDDPAACLARAEIALEQGDLDRAEGLFRAVFAAGDATLRAAALASMTHHSKGRVPLDPRVLLAGTESTD